MKEKKRALVVEGGAMRGIFSIGVLDTLINENMYDFDVCLGVSAGATTVSAYLAGMENRNFRVTVDYSTRKEFLNFSRFLKGGHYMDLTWLWEYCEKYDPLDIKAIVNRNKELYIGVTAVDSGEVEYLKLTEDNAVELLKASCAIPVAYREPVEVEGKLYFDGGIAEPIPIERAIATGAEEIVVIRSRKKEFMLKDKKSRLQDFALRKYPRIKDAFNRRSMRYNKSVEMIRKEHPDVKIIEINPPEEFKTARFTRDKRILIADYKLGREAGKKLIKEFR